MKWKVVTRDNVDEIFDELEKNGERVVLFAVTSDGYEAIALNLNEIRAYLEKQSVIIAAYEDYYKKADRSITEARKKMNGE